MLPDVFKKYGGDLKVANTIFSLTFEASPQAAQSSEAMGAYL